MNIKQTTLVLSLSTATVAVAMASNSALAAQQGTQGASSTGSTDVSLQVNDSVKITGIEDLTIPAVLQTATGGTQEGGSFCVYKNGGDSVKITASNPASGATEFALVGAADGDIIQYTVALETGVDASSTATTAYNTAKTLTGASTEFACGGSDTHSYEIFIAEQEVREATTGAYSGTLQFLVEPI
ncbi:MAG: hypothetical protein ABJ056_01630 [Halioglobus sp.]